ncbi:aminotransferase class I/II-fold pyridoxal phosphate-dependent enzyme [Desulfotomaculum copahuensis]|uniref:methionine gamma-lyase family protein n=1 Tax=Desulfotomaculum copahuensis TaxID=1838280 RepID=UPI00098F8AB0|nr:methionine gamma-lyase family protein [Desulfotomaculum copahuensis]
MDLAALAGEVEQEVIPYYRTVDERALQNHARILAAFHEVRVSDYHLRGGTGYGYGDAGREALEAVYARVFGAESALVRGQIVSGTHAIALCLFGVLRPGDELLAVQGTPYDTLEEMIGLRGEAPGSLKEMGVIYRQVDLLPGGEIDPAGIAAALNPRTRMVMLQRSRGYSLRPSLDMKSMQRLIGLIRDKQPGAVIFVDNCYGEFVEEMEPSAAGADLVAGSLIKNPGGGLAPGGGYVAGRRRYVEMAANRWTAPGIGAEVGPAPDFQRLMFQGLFLAPHVVAEALKGAVFAARLFERLGFPVYPAAGEPRTDIIQAITLGSPRRLEAFCRAIQGASPVDAHVQPKPWDMPGYGDPVIMAAGTFVQGASIELSADAPVREPYVVYMQGGLSKEYVRLAVLEAARAVLSAG